MVISLIILPNGCQADESMLTLKDYPQIFDGTINIEARSLEVEDFWMYINFLPDGAVLSEGEGAE